MACPEHISRKATLPANRPLRKCRRSRGAMDTSFHQKEGYTVGTRVVAFKLPRLCFRIVQISIGYQALLSRIAHWFCVSRQRCCSCKISRWRCKPAGLIPSYWAPNLFLPLVLTSLACKTRLCFRFLPLIVYYPIQRKVRDPYHNGIPNSNNRNAIRRHSSHQPSRMSIRTPYGL